MRFLFFISLSNWEKNMSQSTENVSISLAVQTGNISNAIIPMYTCLSMFFAQQEPSALSLPARTSPKILAPTMLLFGNRMLIGIF